MANTSPVGVVNQRVTRGASFYFLTFMDANPLRFRIIGKFPYLAPPKSSQK